MSACATRTRSMKPPASAPNTDLAPHADRRARGPLPRSRPATATGTPAAEGPRTSGSPRDRRNHTADQEHPKPPICGALHAGGGTRTPDTRTICSAAIWLYSLGSRGLGDTKGDMSARLSARARRTLTPSVQRPTDGAHRRPTRQPRLEASSVTLLARPAWRATPCDHTRAAPVRPVTNHPAGMMRHRRGALRFPA
jgi:hypothetical protein